MYLWFCVVALIAFLALSIIIGNAIADKVEKKEELDEPIDEPKYPEVDKAYWERLKEVRKKGHERYLEQQRKNDRSKM